MYKFLRSILVLLIALDVSCSFAQLVTIPTGNTGSATDRRPYGNFYGYERTAVIYKSADIGAVGTITSFGVYVTASSSPAASTPVKIYMKETTLNSFPASGDTFTSLQSTAKLVYSGNVLSTDLVNSSWLTKTLDTAFFYSGTGNLMILVEANGGGSGIETSSSAKSFRFNTTGNYTYQNWAKDSSPPPGKGTVSSTSMLNVQLNITPAALCTGIPTPGTLTSSVDSVCSGVGFALSLSGQTSGVSGITFQWQKSNDGITFTNKQYNATGTSTTDSISALTYYRVKVTCNGTDSAFSNIVSVSKKSLDNCYCTPTITNACSSNDFIDSFSLNTLLNAASGCNGQANNYISYTENQFTTTLTANGTYTLRLKAGSGSGTHSAAVWIDYNRNGSFGDPGEYYLISNSIPASGSATINVAVPATINPGLTRMRVRYFSGTTINQASVCSSYSYGETEDYKVTLDIATCTNPPASGTITANANALCTDSLLTLTASNFDLGGSLQWQKSSDSIAWSNIQGATNASYSTTNPATAYYRLKVTCTDSTFSNALKITTLICYCKPTFSNGCTGGDMIDSLIINTLVNPASGCNGQPGNYILYPDTQFTTTLMTTVPYSVRLRAGNGTGTHGAGVWIDLNQNGSFADANEFFLISNSIGAGGLGTTNIIIPSTATYGKTRLRVRYIWNTTVAQADACSAKSFGETEDYTITIAAPPSCTNPPAAGTISAANTAVCLDSTTLLTVQNYGLGSSLQWQVSTDSLSWTNVVGGNNFTLTSQQVNGIVYYRLKVTCIDSVFSNVLKLYNKMCYCTPALSNGCGSGDFINNFSINTLSNQGSACNGLPNSYISYSESQFTTTLVEGVSYQVSLTSGSGSGSHGAGVWFDFNNNGTFTDSGEFFLIKNEILPSTQADTVITIPTGTALGKINMRVRYIYNTTVAQANACSSNGFGETEDYIVTIVQPAPCTNPPAAGTIATNNTAVCTNATANLTATNYDLGASIQWQVSSDSTVWSDVANATNAFVTTQAVTAPVFYRLKVTCADSSFSNVIKLVTKLCYCASNATSTSDTKIDSVYFGSIVAGTSASTCESYTDNTNLSTTIQKLFQYPLRVRNGSCGGTHFGAYLGAYIDWNQDGDFDDADEVVYTFGQTTAFGSIPTGMVTVPATALPGATRMRIVLREGSVAASSCGTYGWGETEDYTVVVDTTTPICATPTVGGTISGPDTADANTNGLFVLSGFTGDVISWEISTNPSGPYTSLGVNNDSLVLLLNAVGTFYGRAKVSSNGCASSYSDTFSIVIQLKGDESCDAFVGTIGQNGPYDFTLYTAALNEVRPAGDTCEGTMSWCDQDLLQSIWVKFQAPASGRVYIVSPGTDTRLALWDATDCASLSDSTLGGYTLLAANDDNPDYATIGAEMFSSYIDTVECLVPGKFYYIQLAAYPGFGLIQDTTSLFIYEAPAKDPSFVGLQPVYCEDAGAETLYPTTPGGVFTGAGITPNNEFNPSIAGVGGPFIITYTLTGCYSFNDTVTVSAVPDIANVVIDSVKCKGDSTGSIAIVMASGTAPFVFQWNSGQTDSLLANLTVGQYQATITSADGCVGNSASYSITEPATALTATISGSTDVKCFGGATGGSTVNAQDGTPGYSYLWDNGAGTASVTSLTAGVHSVTVTDANGCAVTLYDTLNQPASALSATSVSTDQVGSTNGSITLTVNGGSPIYQYVWSNAAVSQNITAAAGTYTVTITDANNCTFVLTDTINFISGIEGAYSGVRKISLYPNPTAGDATLLVELENEKPISVEVFDAFGRIVLEQKAASAKHEVIHLDLKDFAAGLYSVRVKVEGSTYTKQLAIQR